MKSTTGHSNFPALAASGHLPAVLASFLATLVSLPASAANPIDYPNVPLQSNSTVPPNIMFILDDSGSMASDFMPAPGAASDTAPTTITTGGKPNIGRFTNALNGIYYNPATDYTPWTRADGTFVADPGPTAAFSSSTTINAGDGTVNLTSSIQTFYVPKTGTGLNDAVNYYRYQILTNGNLVRSELTATTPAAPVTGTLSTTAGGGNGGYSANYTVVLPANVSNLTVTTSAGSFVGGTMGADLYVLQGATAPTTATYTCRSRTAGNPETCSIANPAAGTWSIRLYGNGSTFSNVRVDYSYTLGNIVDANNCTVNAVAAGWNWTGCVVVPSFVRPDGSSERDNFATWYSFHRTRNKAAKAGASNAFADLGENLRVGFNTIWNRSTYRIPVGSDGGLFRDTAATSSTNRTTWFNRLFAATASGATPLQGALQTAGEYYKETGNTGPYGPETGTGQLSCRQNFTILTTDGFWNDQSNFNAGATGNSDGTSTTGIPRPPGDTGTVFAYTAGAPYSDTWTSTLADVAMKYWKTDLRTDLSNKVPVTADDPAYWQHMTTFGISIGLQGTLNPATALSQPGPSNDLTDGGLTWPSPLVAENAARIDDLFHAAVNGRGDFVAATNSDQFADGLRASLAAISRRLASGSSVATTGPRVTGSNKVFSASYFSGSWNGEVAAYTLTATGIVDTPVWKASEQVPAVASRRLFTRNGTTGVPFAWASLSAAQQTALGNVGVFNYLTGVRTGEGTTYRTRESLIGDIVNSSPEYLTELATTTPTTLPAVDTVFVGSNDGMLHAFNGATGAEQFAYVPAGISFGDLRSYSNPTYAHYFFVDGPIVISKRSQTPGKNVLVGALGRGGHGIYALNVANPAAFTAADVLWEQTADADMGNIIGKPIIAKLNNGVTAVIVPNGINSSTHQASLFVYNVLTGALISKLTTAVTPLASATNPNGLSTIRGWDDDSDGDVDYVYGGDVLGNVWRFDLTSAAPGSWSVPTTPLFTARNAANQVQPITGGISVALDPQTFETWVFFGTGRFLVGDDLSNKDIQTWYGIKDGGSAAAAGYAITGRSELTQRQVIYYQAAIEDDPLTLTVNESRPALRAFGPAVAGDMTNKRGWYLDLINPPYGTTEKVGERMVFDPILIAGKILVEASQAPSADPCNVGGTGYVNAVDAFTGAAVSEPFFDINSDGVINAQDKVTVNGNPATVGSIDPNVGMPSTPSVVGQVMIIGGSGGGKPARIQIPPNSSTGRISWREILRD